MSRNLTPSTIRRPGPAAGRNGTRHRQPRHGRHGSIYAVVLGMAVLVSLIGLSAVAAGRATMRRTAMAGEGFDADVLARSAVEHAASTINTDPSWRTRYSNDVETAPVKLGRGSFTWKVVDEADGTLSSGGVQPVRVFGFGRVGEAGRCFSVQLAPGGPNLADNPGVEQGVTGYTVQGGDCTLEARSDGPHEGTRYLAVRSRLGRTAGPQQIVTGEVVSGRSYYVEMWVKMTAGVEEPMVIISAKGSGLLGLPLGATEATFNARAQPVGLEWTKVNVTIPTDWSGTADTVTLRVETAATNQEFKLDDVKLIDVGGSIGGGPPMEPATETWRQDALP